ncbi:unnamed protein product [Periconia digitata]|uniref:Uncharacterized protein n=1 Tax=Periconia digitata TaxID=1303443 RepID=A0A9W4XVM7_9PLEO|nr:unnamed protein product [Periconia digitata]
MHRGLSRIGRLPRAAPALLSRAAGCCERVSECLSAWLACPPARRLSCPALLPCPALSQAAAGATLCRQPETQRVGDWTLLLLLLLLCCGESHQLLPPAASYYYTYCASPLVALHALHRRPGQAGSRLPPSPSHSPFPHCPSCLIACPLLSAFVLPVAAFIPSPLSRYD